MRMFESLKTLNKYHDIYKELALGQQIEFELAVKALFEKKTVSEEGAYSNYKITEKDLNNIKQTL